MFQELSIFSIILTVCRHCDGPPPGPTCNNDQRGGVLGDKFLFWGHPIPAVPLHGTQLSRPLTQFNAYVPPTSSCPGTMPTHFDALLEDRRDQMVLTDYNDRRRSTTVRRSMVRSLQLGNWTWTPASPPRRILSSWAGISSPPWRGAPSPPVVHHYLPLRSHPSFTMEGLLLLELPQGQLDSKARSNI